MNKFFLRPVAAAVVALSLALSACGGGGGSSGDAATAAAPPASSPPLELGITAPACGVAGGAFSATLKGCIWQITSTTQTSTNLLPASAGTAVIGQPWPAGWAPYFDDDTITVSDSGTVVGGATVAWWMVYTNESGLGQVVLYDHTGYDKVPNLSKVVALAALAGKPTRVFANTSGVTVILTAACGSQTYLVSWDNTKVVQTKTAGC